METSLQDYTTVNDVFDVQITYILITAIAYFVLIWDWLSHLNAEYTLMRGAALRTRFSIKHLFLVSRYLTLGWTTFVVSTWAAVPAHPSLCGWTKYYSYGYSVVLLSAHLVMVMRLYSVYERSRSILLCMLGLTLADFAAQMSVNHFIEPVRLSLTNPSVTTCFPLPTSTAYLVVFVSSTILHHTLLAFTLAKSLAHIRLTRSAGVHSIMSIVQRDHVLYTLAICLVNFANLVLALSGGPGWPYKLVNQLPACALTQIFLSRIVFSLHAAAVQTKTLSSVRNSGVMVVSGSHSGVNYSTRSKDSSPGGERKTKAGNMHRLDLHLAADVEKNIRYSNTYSDRKDSITGSGLFWQDLDSPTSAHTLVAGAPSPSGSRRPSYAYADKPYQRHRESYEKSEGKPSDASRASKDSIELELGFRDNSLHRLVEMGVLAPDRKTPRFSISEGEKTKALAIPQLLPSAASRTSMLGTSYAGAAVSSEAGSLLMPGESEHGLKLSCANLGDVVTEPSSASVHAVGTHDLASPLPVPLAKLSSPSIVNDSPMSPVSSAGVFQSPSPLSYPASAVRRPSATSPLSRRSIDDALRDTDWAAPVAWHTPPLESPRGSGTPFSERRLSMSLSRTPRPNSHSRIGTPLLVAGEGRHT